MKTDIGIPEDNPRSACVLPATSKILPDSLNLHIAGIFLVVEYACRAKRRENDLNRFEWVNFSLLQLQRHALPSERGNRMVPPLCTAEIH